MASTWKVTIYLFDADDARHDTGVTKAHAVLSTSAGTTLDGYGRARRAPRDVDVPEIGEELAAARALRNLADRLLSATSDDIEAIEHDDVQLVHLRS
ncbi:hypothetical protein ASD16_07210 [Cellulomonas sp. Root485]|jgi:hypothetical protein|uniref:dsRBD fold-containing protein n=1 Tax=Cellulomonas sp. Root485 TaxID=1736546 RepID=UPI0006F28F9A|nr:dsRBD fold-containing protein [Cellulomonas sp. Root485]KQY25213.1 hypothetical protein ASD16_07210 [Cellulomonas sp. Root485]